MISRLITSDSKSTENEPVCLLMDFGSLFAEAFLGLRIIAAQLSKSSQREIIPISLFYSNTIDVAKLNNQPAEIFELKIKSLALEGRFNILILPLFFGPSRALSIYLPKCISEVKKTYSRLNIHIAPCLVQTENDSNCSFANILANGIFRVIEKKELSKPAVILVDHGTPVIKVNEVRNFLARQLKDLLKNKIRILTPASMERREGSEYSFNDPLLKDQLRKHKFNEGDVIISMLFFLPGRHAGLDGDITRICLEAEKRESNLRTHLTELVGANQKLITLLKKRLDQELLANKWS